MTSLSEAVRRAVDDHLDDPNEWWIFVLYGGIGDQVMWLSWINTLSGANRICVMVDQRSEDIPAMFPGIDKTIVLPQIDSLNMWPTMMVARPGNPVICWHHMFPMFQHEYFAATFGISVMRVIGACLGFTQDNNGPTWPVPTQKGAEIAKEAFKKLDLRQGKVVFFAPGAHTLKARLSLQYIDDLNKHLMDQGLTMVVNTRGGARGLDTVGPVPGFIPSGAGAVDIPLSAAIPFAELCGRTISVHSGFSTLLARADCDQTIIYPYEGTPLPLIHANVSFWSQAHCFPDEGIHEFDVHVRSPFSADYFRDLRRR